MGVAIDNKELKKFKNMKKEREKVIAHEKKAEINLDYSTNFLNERLHPTIQYVVVTNIIKENNDVKTFVLEPDTSLDTQKLAYFLPGQNITLTTNIKGGIYKRPYTLTCSPKHTLNNNQYTITIKKIKDGIVSNYLFNKIKIGSTLEISEPWGNFYYQPLRDAKNIIALVSDQGITRIISLAKAIFDGIIDANLTIIYSNKTKNDILFKEQLEDITCKTTKVKVIHILKDDFDTEYEKGTITKELIDQYLKEENSFFVSGSIDLYRKMNEILKLYNLPKKYIRHALFMSEIDVKTKEEFNLTIIQNEEEINIKCHGDKTLLSAIEENSINAKSRCHVGECGYCKSQLISGKVKTIDMHLRSADKRNLYIHPCSTYPESDVIIKLPN